MSNKHTISLRLNIEEYNMVNDYCRNNHTSTSETIRTFIRNSSADHPPVMDRNAEIAKAFCIIHARMDDLRFYDEEIEEELQKICQMLL